MKKPLIVNKEKVIKATPSEAWKVITNPVYFHAWMFVPGKNTDGERFGLGSKIEWTNEESIVYLEGEVVTFVPDTELVIALQDISWDQTKEDDRVIYEFQLIETETGTKLRFRLGDLSIDPEGQAWYDSYNESDEIGAIEKLILER